MSKPGPSAVPIPLPLAIFERDGLAAALSKAGLSTAGIDNDHVLFWRFENANTPVPLGFGGLEVFGDQALLRSVVTLPPLRRRSIGTHIVTWLETEARIRGCRAAWLATEGAEDFFRHVGFGRCERSAVLQAIRETPAFAAAPAIAMTKRLD